MKTTALRVVHSTAGHYSADTNFGTQLNREIKLTFDGAGQLATGTIRKTRTFTFPVPLPPGAGSITVPYPLKRTLSAADEGVAALAKAMHDAAAHGGGISEVTSSEGSRMLDVVRNGNIKLEHLPGAPLEQDAASLGSQSWGRIREGVASVDIARLGAVLRQDTSFLGRLVRRA
jgi:hypothetical protein